MIFKKEHGIVTCSREYVKELKTKGWVTCLYNTGRVDFIGYELNGLAIGFTGDLSDLKTEISSPEVGVYGDSWSDSIDIKSQEDLDNFIKIIESLISLDSKKND